MTLIEAKEAEAAATKKLGDAQREVLDSEKRLADARKDFEKATTAVRSADADSAGFISRIEAKALAEHRVMAFEDRLKAAQASVSSAKAAAERVTMARLQADLDDAKATLKTVDVDLVDFLREAREGARGRLVNLEKLLIRANAADEELSKRRGNPIPQYLLPRHYQTLCSCLTDSREQHILQFLERIIDNEQHAWRRG